MQYILIVITSKVLKIQEISGKKREIILNFITQKLLKSSHIYSQERKPAE